MDCCFFGVLWYSYSFWLAMDFGLYKVLQVRWLSNFTFLFIRSLLQNIRLGSTFGSRHSRMIQIKFVENSLWSDIVCLSRPYYYKFFKGCLPQINYHCLEKKFWYISHLYNFSFPNSLNTFTYPLTRLLCFFRHRDIFFNYDNHENYQTFSWSTL